MSLVYLNNGSFEEAPNGGDYTRNQSFVVARKDSTSGNVIYYVRLMEDMGDGEYRGINFNTRDELIMDNAFNKVVNINGSDLFKVNEVIDNNDLVIYRINELDEIYYPTLRYKEIVDE